MIHVGFTGTRAGMTPAQLEVVASFFVTVNYDDEMWVLHHGLCVGSDALASRLAYAALGYVIGHPPTNRRLVDPHAWYDEAREPLPYLLRNRAIVDTVDVMLATPREEREVLRSGTWATIRYARDSRRPLYIINPDGRIV
jgi:hypothetical protein